MPTVWSRFVSLSIASCLLSTAQAAEIIPIATLGLGVSGAGTVVVGAFDDGAQLLASRWTAQDGLQDIGQGTAYDISRDGTTIVGERFLAGTQRSFRWNAQQGLLDLGALANGNNSSNAIDVSGNGDVVVGLANQATGFRGFRWTQPTGMVALGDLPGGFNFSQANSISADGQVTVGVSTGSAGDRAVRWVGANTTPIDLGLPPGLPGFTEAKGVSGNGEVVVGVWGVESEFINEAFRWTALGGYELLGDFPGGILDSVATATNFDGSAIVGTGNPGEDVPDEAFYWTAAGGLRSLREVLLDAGADLSAWRTLNTATSLSDDGRIVVGTGTLSDGSIAGFRANIQVPEPSGLMILAIAGVFAIHRKRLGILRVKLNHGNI